METFVCHREMKADLTQTGDTIAMKVRWRRRPLGANGVSVNTFHANDNTNNAPSTGARHDLSCWVDSPTTTRHLAVRGHNAVSAVLQHYLPLAGGSAADMSIEVDTSSTRQQVLGMSSCTGESLRRTQGQTSMGVGWRVETGWGGVCARAHDAQLDQRRNV